MSEALQTELAFTIHVQCDAAIDLGAGAGGQRRLIPIVGGTIEGPRLHGSVLPGGADTQLVRPDGVLEIDARYTLRASDGTHVSVHNHGLVVSGALAGQAQPYVRTSPRFEAPVEGPHAWLNRSVFLGTIGIGSGPAAINVRIDVFRVL